MHFYRLLLTCVLALTISGCAVKKVEMRQTGFLNNYEELSEDEEVKGMMSFKNTDVNISENYSKIQITPVEFILDPEAESDLTQEDRDKLSDYFHEKLEEYLAENYELTDSSGNGVMQLRTAITGILPNKVYLNLHWSTTLYGAGIGGASIEAELVDSITNQRILAFIDGRKGKRLNYTKGLSKWGHTQEVLEKWAKILVNNLDELREGQTEGAEVVE